MNVCDGLPITASCAFMEHDTLKWLTNLNRGKPEADIFMESLPVTNSATSSGKALFQNKSHFLRCPFISRPQPIFVTLTNLLYPFPFFPVKVAAAYLT